MGNCVSDDAHKYVQAVDEKKIISHGSRELQGLMEQRINVKSVSNGDDIIDRSISTTNYMMDCSRSSSLLMHNPCKPANTNNLRRNIAAPSQQCLGGGSVRRLKVVISAKELWELLNSDDAAHENRQVEFASLVLEKLSVKGETSAWNGAVAMRNSRSSCISTRSVQGKGSYENNYHSWRPSLEYIPENFTEIE